MNNTEIKLILSVDEANTILMALQELPAKVANPLTKKIQEQAQSQLATNEPTEQVS
jgi:hypothetical protein